MSVPVVSVTLSVVSVSVHHELLDLTVMSVCLKPLVLTLWSAVRTARVSLMEFAITSRTVTLILGSAGISVALNECFIHDDCLCLTWLRPCLSPVQTTDHSSPSSTILRCYRLHLLPVASFSFPGSLFHVFLSRPFPLFPLVVHCSSVHILYSVGPWACFISLFILLLAHVSGQLLSIDLHKLFV